MSSYSISPVAVEDSEITLVFPSPITLLVPHLVVLEFLLYADGVAVPVAEADKIGDQELVLILDDPIGNVSEIVIQYKLYGPFIDGGAFKIAKLISIKTMPDTVRARHILPPTANVDPAAVKKTADSLLNNLEPKFKKVTHQVLNGETFDNILKEYSLNGLKNVEP